MSSSWSCERHGDVSPLHVAPRLSLILPTGSEEEGRGTGSLGLQTNLPLSYVLSDALAAHARLLDVHADGDQRHGPDDDHEDWHEGDERLRDGGDPGDVTRQE